MHKLYSHRGLVLAIQGIGEKNSFVFIFSEGLGVVRAKAISSREAKGKLKGHITPYSIGVYTFVRGKDGWRLIQASAETNIFSANKDITKKKIIARVCKLLLQMANESVEKELFTCVHQAFQVLPSVDDSVLKTFEATLVSRILFILGYLSFENLPTELKNFDDFSDVSLLAIKHHEKELIRLINMGLEESQLVKAV